MIIVNRIGDNISVSYNNVDKTIPYSEEKFKQLFTIAEKSETTSTMENMKTLFEEVEVVIKQEEEKYTSSIHPRLTKCKKTGKVFMILDVANNIVSSIALPEAMLRRIEESSTKGIDVEPLMKCWTRFLRNPKIGDVSFRKKFFNYLDMTYVSPIIKQEKLDAGYSEDVAKQLATVYQVKITKEGLINCYKVSQEVDWKYEADEDGSSVKKNLYNRTFDALTGEVIGDSREELTVEERIFIPAVQGLSGDSFYCEGGKGDGKLGHQIRVGSVHRLPDWSFVDCDDARSCVPGLHVGKSLPLKTVMF